jgi:hypothetical protein
LQPKNADETLARIVKRVTEEVPLVRAGEDNTTNIICRVGCRILASFSRSDACSPGGEKKQPKSERRPRGFNAQSSAGVSGS